jgi:ACS family tartrate transporter-like MFS transporter
MSSHGSSYGAALAPDRGEFAERVATKVIRNVLYFVNQLDRVNISFAALTMNKDIGLTAEMYGFGAGIFFVGYFLFEVPSNLIMQRVGARLWMFRIMLTWGLISAAMAWIHSPITFYSARFLLGLAEAGFVPGMFLYLSYWIPQSHTGRATGLFIIAAPLSTVLAGPLSTILLQLDGALGLRGWQWMFIVEGVPAIVLAFVTLWALPDRPEQARWLSKTEKEWLAAQIGAQERAATGSGGHSIAHGFASPVVLLLSAIYVSMVVGLYGIAFWLPQIVRGIGFSNLQTGFVVAVPYALGTVSCIVWSRRSDRHLERRWHFALPSFLAAFGLMASAVMGSQWLTLLPISLALIGIWAAVPVFWCVPGRHLSGLAAATGLAVINAVGNLGGFAGPYLVGWLREGTGSFTMALVVLSAGPLLAGLLALCLPANTAATLAPRPAT